MPSLDNAPTYIIEGHEYEFVVVAEPDNHYDNRCSRHTDKDKQTTTYVAARLRDIADRIEGQR